MPSRNPSAATLGGHTGAMLLAVFLSSLFIVGCVTHDDDFATELYSVSWPKAEAAMQARMAELAAAPRPAVALTGKVTLEAAVARAVANDGELAALAARMQAELLEADSDAAAPDPKLRLRVDDFAGSGIYSGSGNSQQSLRVAQVVELNGKGEARRRVGRLDAAVTGSRRAVRRLDVTLATSQAFYRALAAQRRLDVATECVGELDKRLAALKSLSGMGGADGRTLTRTQVALATAKARKSRAAAELTAARNALSATWGDGSVGFESLSGDLAAIAEPSELEPLAARLPAAPDVYEYEAEARMHRAERDLARRGRTPDIELLAGVSHDQDSGDHGFFAAVEIELPFRAWSGREARAAESRAVSAESRLRSVVSANARRLADAHGRLRGAYDLATTYADEVIPICRGALEAAEAAEAEGAESPWNIVRAVNDLYDAQLNYADALEDYHMARLETERLTAATDATRD